MKVTGGSRTRDNNLEGDIVERVVEAKKEREGN